MSLVVPVIESNNLQELSEHYKSERDDKLLRELVYKASFNVIQGKAKTEPLVSFLENLINSNENVLNIYLDVLNVLEIETSLQSNQPDMRVNFIDLLVNSNGKIVTDWALKDRLEYSTVEEAKIINNARQLSTKFVKLKTKLFYKQKKYNLFREENEGFSKLIAAFYLDKTFDCPIAALKYIKSLIGSFNLDPNRVIDIILESFEQDIDDKAFFIKIIEQYFEYFPRNFDDNCTDIVSSIMAKFISFKFNFYSSENQEDPLPESLFDVTALLIGNNFGNLSQLESLLAVEDEKVNENYDQEIAQAKKFGERMTVLADEGIKIRDINIFENERSKVVSSNKRLGLINSFIKFGDWKNAETLIQSLPEYFAVSYPEIGNRLCHLIEYLIDPMYLKNSTLPEFLSKKLRKFDSKLDIEQVHDIAAMEERVLPLIFNLGPFIHRSPLLITKILRICSSLMSDKENNFQASVMKILMISIIPSFPLLETNPPVAEELWNLLEKFQYHERYFIYNFWRNEPVIPLLIKKKIQVTKRIKYIMKRISSEKDQIKSLGRSIAKLSFSYPILVFEYILDKIQTFDNMIVPVRDSLRYLGTIFFDVIMFCVVDLLSKQEKDFTKQADGNIAQWLLSLANFTGLIAKKYSVELQGIVQFVANQLKLGKVLDMVVLKEIVSEMTGIETADDITPDQLEALSGGEMLKSEASMFNKIKNMKRSSLKLKEALLQDDLASSLCVLMAQQRVAIAFQSEDLHLKLVGKLYDQCQDTLVQFGYFLADSLTIDDYQNRLPSIRSLLEECHLNPDVAFFLARPMINHQINSKYIVLGANFEAKSPKLWGLYAQAANEVLPDVVNAVSPLLQKQNIQLNPELFTTFWSMSMFDINVPEKSYKREKSKIDQAIAAIDALEDAKSSKNQKERERLVMKQMQLVQEENEQIFHTERVMKRLEQESKLYFQEIHHKMENTTNFIQHCLFPRCKFTPYDAMYCVKFVHLLHLLKTPNFSTLLCFDKIFSDIMCIVSSLTQNEANNYGRFLCSLMKVAMHWHSDISIYNDECAEYPGVVTKFSEAAPMSVDYENFRHICHKWHYRIAKSVIACFDSREYIIIRNALIVLTRLLPMFPKIRRYYEVLEGRIVKIQELEKDKRQDLYILATGYLGQINQKKHLLVRESDFHLVEQKPQNSVKSKLKAKREIEETFDENSKGSVDRTKDEKTPEKDDAAVPAKAEKRILEAEDSQDSQEPKAKEMRVDPQEDARDHRRDHRAETVRADSRPDSRASKEKDVKDSSRDLRTDRSNRDRDQKDRAQKESQSRDNKDTRDQRESKQEVKQESKHESSRDQKEVRDVKDREQRDLKETSSRHLELSKDPKESSSRQESSREVKESRDHRDSKHSNQDEKSSQESVKEKKNQEEEKSERKTRNTRESRSGVTGSGGSGSKRASTQESRDDKNGAFDRSSDRSSSHRTKRNNRSAKLTEGDSGPNSPELKRAKDEEGSAKSSSRNRNFDSKSSQSESRRARHIETRIGR